MAEVKCPSCGAPIQVAEKKTGLWWGIGCLLMVLSIPFILGVVGLLAAIAIPSFINARETSQLNACVNNLRVIEEAKRSVVLTHPYKDGDAVAEPEVSPLLKNGFGGLVCPKGGRYMINPVGQAPECSVHGTLRDALEKRHRRGLPSGVSGE